MDNFGFHDLLNFNMFNIPGLHIKFLSLIGGPRINPSELTWRDSEANVIIADDSVLVKNLGQMQKQNFLNLVKI